MQVPTIDISSYFHGGDAPSTDERSAVARQWNAAFATIGFANIVGHGIEAELLDAVQQSGRAFFDLPLAAKQMSSFSGEKKSQGYFQVGLETVNKAFINEASAAAPPDLVETLTFAFVDWEQSDSLSTFERSIFRRNLWPAHPEGFSDVLRHYHARLFHVAQVLMEISAEALRLPTGFFDPQYQRMATSLRLAHYPEQEQEPLPCQLRYGAHTDYMGYTILLQDQAPGGLQVQDPEGSWVDVPPTQGAFTVNCGDLLSRWTNGLWKSNVHRVVNPPRSADGATRRLSVVMFTGPDYAAEITCIPTCVSADRPAMFAPIKCWDHFQSKVDASLN